MHFPLLIQPKTEEEKFMIEALKEAYKAFEEDEVPVGAVLVHEGRVIARGHNQVEMLKDATAHAEMLCITAGETAMDNWRLSGATLYVTMEPCCMCAGAMFLSRVTNLVWGAPDIRHGANGSFVDLFKESHPTHSVNVTSGVLADYSAALLREFFEKKRIQKKKKDG